MLDDDSYPLPGAVERCARRSSATRGSGCSAGSSATSTRTDGRTRARSGSFDWFLRAGQGGAPADGHAVVLLSRGRLHDPQRAFLEAGGWFEPYYLALSELDLATRMIAAAGTSATCPTAQFDHMKASGGMRGAPAPCDYRIRNQIWYFWLRFPIPVAALRIPFYLTFDLIESSYRGVVGRGCPRSPTRGASAAGCAGCGSRSPAVRPAGGDEPGPDAYPPARAHDGPAPAQKLTRAQ